MRRLSSILLAAALVFAFSPAALAAAPDNDERSGATVITTLPYTVENFDTTEATYNAATDPLCWTLTSWESTVWYSFTATATGRIMVDNAATVPQVFVRVWDTADEDVMLSCYDQTSPAYVDAVAGHTYMIMFGDADASDGTGGMLSFTVTGADFPIQLEIDVAVSGASLDGASLIVTGTWAKVAGNDVTEATLSAAAEQKGKGKARPPVSGAGPGVINADGTWTATLEAYQGAWGPGRTSLSLDFFFNDGTTTTQSWVVAAVNVPRK